MRYLGISYDQLMLLPAWYVPIVAEIAQREASAARLRQNRRRK